MSDKRLKFGLNVCSWFYWILATEKLDRCKYGDTECMAKSLNKLLREHYEGIPEIGLASMDPLHFTDVSLSQGGNSPVTMDLKVPVGDILGWRTMVVEKVMYVFFLNISKFELIKWKSFDLQRFR